ncbi:site-specific DNA-methyltransferase [Sphingomonas endophytica]|uniref:site-specific DNA-methyltransferase (adenine-specific) n=1 Tax=Sphingomonas endophytica TaxID=869719 RepID=A0A147I6F2_9SPHN|nr:site-specific DNA-methyltransferase [Sphingomonas endophytica]KTT74449.1 hypothetical protein NS334_05400 [Sphingomonas endophytica]
MPTLEFKGKPFVYAHHLSVPFRELRIDAARSLPGPAGPSLDDNLIIHGDNLEALKALLPRYAGKVDVIYIDPPYNTGKEGWRYNDNVKAPGLREWLGRVVDEEDMERHDKWLTMMWPRLKLLRELLSPTGIVLIHIDEHEEAALSMIGDEILVRGETERYGTIVWDKGNPKGDASGVACQHESLLVWGPEKAGGYSPAFLRPKPGAQAMLAAAARFRADDPATAPARYAEWVRGEATLTGGERPYNRIDHAGDVYRLVHMGWPNKKRAPDEYFAPLRHPVTGAPTPMPARGWRYPVATMRRMLGDGAPVIEPDGSVSMGEIVFPADNDSQPQRKYRLKDNLLENVPSVLRSAASDDAFFAALGLTFENPKPARVAQSILGWVVKKDALILDSFAGSGTTAQAVLALNKADGGNRRFILIETEDYADTLTAERVRRVASGVAGAKDATLRDGLGGSFTYCTLGEAMDLERFFAGDGRAPAWERVAEYVAYTATGATLNARDTGPDGYAGEAGGFRLHLLYRPDPAWMRSNDAMLDTATAERIAAAAAGRPVLVFAAGKFMAQKALTDLGLTFCQLPYAIHRMLGVDAA